ncbi:MAG: hypothetical protein ACJ75F_09250 [Flavisolibacter sp.]|jgi:hypothetical protein
MKIKLSNPLILCSAALLLIASCGSHNYYTSSSFEQQTRTHKIIAILPAEMIFTGVPPKNITPDQIAKIEETESTTFQNSLFNGILNHANSKKYTTYISVQDISTTLKLLQENNIGVRQSWKEDDKKLANLLGVDAVVRMRIQKKRYMSDLASMGIDMGTQVLSTISGGRLPVPYVSSKTNDLYASCNVISDGRTLWNDSYRGSTDYNSSSEDLVNNITDLFGRHFPYRKRR